LFPLLPDPFYEENVPWMGPILKGRVGLIEHLESFFATDEQTNPPDFEDGGTEKPPFKMLEYRGGYVGENVVQVLR
jgi:hypothetical protein